ncbi:WXG100 family type VII secretion target [Kitasatospora sp. NPDC058048]|uniref:WXG100 family type VII secretion target n=1 Tax=Kitasatospora sp. NPDC058048 TaxID=3346313 RepID=UPI0036DF4790
MVYTDFTKYSHAQLRTMAQALDPGAVMAAGDPWRKAADTLKQIRQTLTKASTEAATSWEGTTSDAFHTRMLTLAASINNAAAYANDAANILHTASEAMAKAKRDMPEEPGNWDKVKDTVGDALFGDDDEHLPLADRKKAEAAAIMQTLAMHYRIATPALKPPPPLDLRPRQPIRDDPTDGAQGDPSGAAATAAAMVSGTSVGAAGASTGARTAPPPQRKSSQPPMTARLVARSAPAPTDSGIKGGTAQAPPKPVASPSRGSGDGISGRPVVPTGGSMPNPALAGTQTSGVDLVQTGGPAAGPFGGGNGPEVPRATGPTTASPGGPIVGPGKLGAGGRDISGGATPVESFGPRGARTLGGSGEASPGIGAGGRGALGGKQPGGSLARPGGAAGDTAKPGGVQGKQAFTEGGSGLGARSRLRGESGVASTSGVSSGVPLSGAQGHKKDRGREGKRPDYLVEDEETWASDKPANPNVVE